ncbi:hypothetical protein EB093_07920 [bacterium]|nr:hypothetical protein [bacterium]
MDKFYAPVLIGALVLLITILIVVGVVIAKLQSNDLYPPTYATCPDYWDVSANPDYCGVYVESNTGRNQGVQLTTVGGGTTKRIDTSNSKNVGLCRTPNKFGCKYGATEATADEDSTDYIPTAKGFTAGTDKLQYLKLNNNDDLTTRLYPGTTDRCAKKRWADTMGIAWDGVTNFNGC